MAEARCSAVCTLRSTSKISCARGMRTLYRNGIAEMRETGPRSARPESAVSRALVRRREGSEPARGARPAPRRRRAAAAPSTSGLPSNTARNRSSTTTASAQVGPRSVQDVQRGRGQDAVAQRAQPDDRHPRALRQTFEHRCHSRAVYSSTLASSTSITGCRREPGRRACTARTSARSGRVSAPPAPCRPGTPGFRADLC